MEKSETNRKPASGLLLLWLCLSLALLMLILPACGGADSAEPAVPEETPAATEPTPEPTPSLRPSPPLSPRPSRSRS